MTNEAAAQIAETTVLLNPRQDTFKAEDVAELLSRQRQLIAERLRSALAMEHQFENSPITHQVQGYRVECSCGWVSKHTYGGMYTRDESCEMLEKVLHLVTALARET